MNKPKKKNTGDVKGAASKRTFTPQQDATVKTVKANAGRATDNSHLPSHVKSQTHGLPGASSMTRNVRGAEVGKGKAPRPQESGGNDEVKRMGVKKKSVPSVAKK
jgi:hypothetical protein